MTRIVYVADAELPSQAANAVQVLKMVSAFGALGHEVRLLAPWHRNRLRGPTAQVWLREAFVLDGPFRLSYLPYVKVAGRLGGSYFPIASGAARLLRPELVYTRNARIAELCLRLGCRVVLETHSVVAQGRALAATRRLRSAPGLARWVFISDRLRARYAQSMPLPEGRCLVAHDAIDLERFTPRVDKLAARQRLGLAVEPPLVVYVGHLYAGRGAELLVDVARARADIDFLLVGGTTADVARIRGLADAAGVHNVELVGHKPIAELPSYLFAADVLVIPHTSRSMASDRQTAISDYASPMKLFEYMAAGRAIVATRFPSITEILVDGTNGILVPPDSAAALADGIGRALGDPALAANLGEQARRDVATRTWRRRAAEVLTGLL